MGECRKATLGRADCPPERCLAGEELLCGYDLTGRFLLGFVSKVFSLGGRGSRRAEFRPNGAAQQELRPPSSLTSRLLKQSLVAIPS